VRQEFVFSPVPAAPSAAAQPGKRLSALTEERDSQSL
jgi:hypothetical protein